MSSSISVADAALVPAVDKQAEQQLDDSGWLVLDFDEERLAQGSPRSPASAAAPPSEVHTASGTDMYHEEQEEHHSTSGLASPQSERLADDVLRQPFGAGPGVIQDVATTATSQSSTWAPAAASVAQGPLLASSHAAAATAAAVAVAVEATEAAAAADADEAESVRSLSRMSQEGSLDCFSLDYGPRFAAGAEDEQPDDDSLQALDEEHAATGLLAGLERLWAGIVEDVAMEVAEVKQLLGGALSAAWVRALSTRDGLHAAAANVRQALREGLPRSCPLWALLSLGSITVLAVVALASQLYGNRRLSGQLKARDRELARLVVKILHLQDALQSMSRGGVDVLLRHTSMMCIA